MEFDFEADMDVDDDNNRMFNPEELVKEIVELHRVLQMNSVLTPSTFLKSLKPPDEDEDDDAESKMMQECSGMSADSGYGNEVLTDDLPSSFEELDIGIPVLPKTPVLVSTPFGKSPGPAIQVNFPKTPTNPIEDLPAFMWDRLSTPLRRALLNSPESSPDPAPPRNKPLFRCCFAKVLGGKNTSDPVEFQPPPNPKAKSFRMCMSKPILGRATNVGTTIKIPVIEPPVVTIHTTAKPEPGQPKVLQKLYKSQKQCTAFKKTNEALKAKINYLNLKDEDLPKSQIISDTVYNLVRNDLINRPQISVQHPMTTLQMEHFKEKVRATKRGCDCPCYCGVHEDCGPSHKKFFSATIPPLTDGILDKLSFV